MFCDDGPQRHRGLVGPVRRGRPQQVQRDGQQHEHYERGLARAPCRAVFPPVVVSHIVVPVLGHPVPTQERIELFGPRFARREIRRGIGDRRRVLHHLAPPNFLHVAGDLDHLVKAGKLRVPVQYLARAADAVGQAAVTEVRGVAFVDDGCVVLETQHGVLEEVGRVFLIFVR